jgi:hypothetical protein
MLLDNLIGSVKKCRRKGRCPMFGIIGSEARRFSGRFQVPWTAILLVAILLIALAVGTFGARGESFLHRVPSGDAPTPAAQVAVPAVQRPVAAPVTNPVIKEWPKVPVVWQQIAQPAGATLFTKIDDGLYTGTTQNAIGWNSRPEDNVFGEKILSQSSGNMTNFIVGAVRDPTDKNIVFVAIMASDSSGTREARLQGKPVTEEMLKLNAYLFLSVDGEKSWYEVNLPPQIDLRVGAAAVRVNVEGNTVHLVTRDNTIAEVWYGAELERSKLPTP